MSNLDVFLLVVGLIGTIAFAISGALTAIENKLDAFGVIILAVVTACGGGLIRDLMLRQSFAVFTDWWYPLISVGVGFAVFFIMLALRNLAWEDSIVYKTIFMVIDALGLGAFVVVGAMRAQSYGVSSGYQIIFYSVITGVGGGMLRDILVCKIPVIFRKHIYACAAIIGGVVYFILSYIHASQFICSIVTVTIVVLIRYLAFHFKWNFPRIHLKNEE